MLILPAIDLRGGQCVRLRQGDYAQETVFDNDPIAVARRFVEMGAKFLHLVDLDGAKAGRPINTDVVGRIAKAAGVPCQLGGGLRDESSILTALELGVRRVILGTRAVSDPEWLIAMAHRFPGKIVLGLDARDGRVATAGWLAQSEQTAAAVLDRHRELSLAAVVYTDIAKDGMMAGPNFDETSALAKVSPFPVIASGGISSVEDVLELRRRGIGACILGRSIYEGSVKLNELLRRLGPDQA